MLETKFSDDRPSASIIDFHDILNIPAVQLLKEDNIKKVYKNKRNHILAVTAHRWL
jgi:hypothetical protein